MQEHLLRELASEYEAIRAENRAEGARRLSRATGIDPEIGALYEKRRLLFREKAEAAFASPDRALGIGEALTREVEAMQAELRARLVHAGFPEDYLQPVYQCHNCHDTGYVGELLRERCACLNQRLMARAVGGAGLDARETFETYDDSVYSDTPLKKHPGDTQRIYMARIRDRCVAYAELFPENPLPNLFFFGASGLGKTFLMNCIGNRVAARGYAPLKVTSYQLTERMRAAAIAHDGDTFRALIEAELLLIDDLGSEAILENVSIVQLFTLLNERELAGLPTIISTNLSLNEFKARYTERICSRLFDRRATLICEFAGKDVRLGLSERA